MDTSKENSIILYQDENELTRISVRFSYEDVWLTQAQLAEIYDTTQQNIDQHIRTIYKDKELVQEATYKKYLLVRREGTRDVEREMKLRESDFDKLVKALAKDLSADAGGGYNGR